MISDDNANQVLNQLAMLGHFNDDEDNVNVIVNVDDSLESYRQFIQRQKESSKADKNSRCQLISTVTDDCYYTTPIGVINDLIHQLEIINYDKKGTISCSDGDGGNGSGSGSGGEFKVGGRVSLRDLCREINVDYELFLPSSSLHHHQEESLLWKTLLLESSSEVTVLGCIIGGGVHNDVELVSKRYWEKIHKEVVRKVNDEDVVLISDLMSRYSLSREEILKYVVTTNNCADNGIRLMDDSKKLVSDRFVYRQKQDVIKYFGRLDEPTNIDTICQQQDWELNQVLDWLNEKESCTIIKGDIHMDTATSQTATFLPTSYRKRQEQDILEFITANGYITMERAQRQYQQGLSVNQITTLVRDVFPGVIMIGSTNDDDEVLVNDNTLQQFRVGIQNYLSSPIMSEVMDLQEYLPVDLIKSTIVPSILEKSGFNTSSADGIAVIGKYQAIIVSNEIVKQIENIILSQLVQEYAKVRANEIIEADMKGGSNEDEDDNDDDNGNEESTTTARKGGKSRSKRKGNKSSKHNNKSSSKETKNVSVGAVPLSIVAAAIIESYPSFQNDDEILSDSFLVESMDWDQKDEDSNEISSLVVSFCRQVLYTESFIKQCERGVNAELLRLRSEMNSKTKISRKDAAAKVRSVEAAFQDAFITLCHIIQAQAKFISFASNNSDDIFDEISMKKLKEEFLRGPCADLTSRITQYRLFQDEDEEDSIFTFVHPTTEVKEKENENISCGLPPYCIDVDITARRHPKSYLSCPAPREPLAVLRESFSGNTGIVLSRLWKKCGGECYRGGLIKSQEGEEEDSEYTVPGDMDFLSYAEENCLTLCGLPYKKLDKKAEKNLLFSRKQQLNHLLTNTDVTINPVDVLEFTIMILFQQVRNLIVFGSLLRGPILLALVRERKIPSSIGVALQTLNKAIDNNTVDDVLVQSIKDCGLVRDVNKHDTTILDDYHAKRKIEE
ncbi:MAG: hypothetical protein ACI90V_002909 [Bacillariaceae sp.]|jgi:hypothetical protein